MNLDLAKNYSNWISGFTKDQFDSFIKIFLRQYFKVDTVVLIDGSSDGGNDFKALENGKKEKSHFRLQ